MALNIYPYIDIMQSLFLIIIHIRIIIYGKINHGLQLYKKTN